MKVAIRDIEYYLPELIEDRAALSADNPDWRIDDIEKKTGVKQRYCANAEQTAVDLGILAAEKLIGSKVSIDDIDFLIFITQSPDYSLPTSACVIQNRLGLKKSCMAFDINLGCSGYVYGISVAGSLIESGLARSGLVICADTYTKYIGKHDRTCRPIFSDGAAATFISATEQDTFGPCELGTDGSGCENLIVPGSGARSIKDNEVERQLFMNGSKVFMFTMSMVPAAVNTLLDKAELSLDDIDLFVFHQASKVVLDTIQNRLSISDERIFNNYEYIGNTVSATIPIALKDACDAGRVNAGDRVMLIGFGVGYSWGACILQW